MSTIARDENGEIEKSRASWSPFARLVSICVVFAELGLTFIYSVQPDVLAALTLIPPWCWLVPLAIVVAILVRLQKGRTDLLFTAGRLVVSSKRLILIACLIFVVLHVEEAKTLFRMVLPYRATDSEEVVRVVSLNCNIGNPEAVREALAIDADVYLFQESPGVRIFNELGVGTSESPWRLAWSGDTSVVVKGTLQPVLVDQESHFTHVVAQLDNGLEFDCVSLRLLPPVYRVDFWDPGFWNDHKNRRQDHRLQLNEIGKHLAQNQRTETLVLGGDFNATSNDGAIIEQLMELDDSFACTGKGWGHTGTNEIPLFRVDQIWTSARLESTRSAAHKTQFSDHRMVVSDFEFNRLKN